MAINPLQAFPSTAYPDLVPVRKSSGGASGFEALLKATRDSGEGSGSHPGQSIADLLRMEMMLSSLALAADAETAAPASHTTIQTLFASFRHGTYFARRPVGGGADLEVLERQAEETGAGAAKLAGIEATAAQYLGAPYRFGGEGRDGIDCSSLVQQVFHEHRVELPRTAREQSQVGREVAEGELRKGDLVFFKTCAPYPSHVGIYLGGGKMIHASSEKGEVTVSDMNSEYYRSRYLGAKRVA